MRQYAPQPLRSDDDAVRGIYVLLEARRPEWHSRAACAGHDPNLFFADERSGRYHQARQLCDRCPVAAECFEAGRREKHGMWGGATYQQRRTARTRALSGRSEPNTAVG